MLSRKWDAGWACGISAPCFPFQPGSPYLVPCGPLYWGTDVCRPLTLGVCAEVFIPKECSLAHLSRHLSAQHVQEYVQSQPAGRDEQPSGKLSVWNGYRLGFFYSPRLTIDNHFLRIDTVLVLTGNPERSSSVWEQWIFYMQISCTVYIKGRSFCKLWCHL